MQRAEDVKARGDSGQPVAAPVITMSCLVGVLSAVLGGCLVGGEPDQVWTAGSIGVRLIDHDGGPEGPCSVIGTVHSYSVSDRRVSWQVCQRGSGVFRESSATIDDHEARRLDAALANVTASRRRACVADANPLSIVVTAPADEREYFTDARACDNPGDYVSGLDGVASAFGEIEAGRGRP